MFNRFGSPAILGFAIHVAPVDRRLCVPNFRWVCLTPRTMHKGPKSGKGVESKF